MTVEEQITRLNDRLFKYRELSLKSWPDIMSKQGGKLADLLSRRLRGIAPVRGAIRAQTLERLAAGGGIRVRKTARKFADQHSVASATNIKTRRASHFVQATKTGAVRSGGLNWWQLAVQREINIRESGRGFLSVSSHYRKYLSQANFALSKFGPVLSRAGISVRSDGAAASITWDPSDSELASSAAAGLGKTKGRAMIALALRDLIDDIDIYITDRAERLKVDAGLN